MKTNKELLSLVESTYEKELRLSSLQYQEKYQAELDAKTKELEIETLKKDKKRLNTLYSVLGISSLLLLAFLFSVLNSRKQKRFNSILEKRSEELSQSNEKLESQNKELERFAFISSHDLKTPLLSIIGFSELLEKEVKELDQPNLLQYTNFISSSGKRMNELIEGVLEYSGLNLDDEKEQVEDESINLHDIVNETRVALMHVKDDKPVNILFEGEALNIKANRSKIYSLFQNLIGNGLHYNESPDPTVCIRVDQTKENLLLSFTDNGIGIPKEQQENVFVMFKRLHNQNKYTGTGLGLAIVKKIVEDMKGSISLKSELGGGSTFEIKLPKSMIAA